MNNSRRILWLLPKWPFPVHCGSRHAAVSLIRGLSSFGEEIDVLACVGSEDVVDIEFARRELGVGEVFITERPTKEMSSVVRGIEYLGSMLRSPRTPVTMSMFAGDGFRSRIRELLATGSYEVMVYEGLHLAMHSSERGRYVRSPYHPKIIYRAQNRETDIWERRAAHAINPVEKAFLSFQAKQVQSFEDSVLRGVDGLATVSPDDFCSFRPARFPNLAARVVPIGYEGKSLVKNSQVLAKTLAFVGKLDWLPNREGLAWFLREVWPQAKTKVPSLQLVVAGSGAAGSLLPLLSQDGITFLGEVESVDQIYAQAALAIVPIFYGGGTRVKVIEASRFGCPTMSTFQGVEGLEFQAGVHYRQAESASEWLTALETLDSADLLAMGRRARMHVTERFSVTRAAEEFRSLLDTISSSVLEDQAA